MGAIIFVVSNVHSRAFRQYLEAQRPLDELQLPRFGNHTLPHMHVMFAHLLFQKLSFGSIFFVAHLTLSTNYPLMIPLVCLNVGPSMLICVSIPIPVTNFI